MATEQALRDRRAKAREREQRVDKLIVADELDLERILAEIAEERDEREQFERRRKELREALEAEIRADSRGAGEHDEQWEEWVEARRDELADLTDASEDRLDRLVKKAAREEKVLKELRRRDGKLEHRIERVTRQLREIERNRAGQLTKDFHVEEFNCKDGTRVLEFCPYIVPHLRAMCEQHLQPLRDSNGPVGTTSALRPIPYNRSIGGAEQSYHCYEIRKRAPAVDHTQSGRSAGAVQQWHEGHNPFDGMGFYAGFTHGDDRGYRSRWYGAG